MTETVAGRGRLHERARVGARATSRRSSCSSPSDAAADVSGQVFVVWGTRVHLMQGWHARQHARPRRGPLDAAGARRRARTSCSRAAAARSRRWASGSSRDGLRRRRPTGRCSSTSCASWPGVPRRGRGYVDLDAEHHDHVSRVGRAARTRPRAGSSATAVSQRATASRSTCPTSTACAGSSRTRRCTRPGAVMVPANTRLSVAGAGRRSSATPRSRAIVHVRGLLDTARTCRDAGAVAAIDRVRRRHRAATRSDGTTRSRPRRRAIQVPRRRRRHGRHHVHVGHDRPAEGRARPAPQRRDDAERRAALDRHRLAARRAAVHVRRA